MALRPGSSCVSRATPLSQTAALLSRPIPADTKAGGALKGDSRSFWVRNGVYAWPHWHIALLHLMLRGRSWQNQVYTIADQISPETAATISAVLGPVFAVGTLLMTIRIITTWYPETDGRKMPWLLVYFPTEWILAPTRKVVPPSFGVDVSPVVWVAIISFANEILLGPQGILNLIIRQQLASS